MLAVRLLTPGQPVSIIGDTVTWTLVRNSGAAFSMATGYTWVLTLIATGVVIGIIWMGRRLVSPWWALGLGMILGGAMGNLVDRFFRSPGPLRGHVVDFSPSAGGRCSTSPTRRWSAGRSCSSRLSLFGFDFDTVGRRRHDGTHARDPARVDDPFDAGPRRAGGHARRRGLARLLGLSRTAAAALAEDGGVDVDGAARASPTS